MPGRVHFARQDLTPFALKVQQNLALSFERDQVQRAQMGPAPFSDPGFIGRLPSEVQRRGGGRPGLQELQGECEPKYLYAMRIMTLEGLIGRHHSSVGPG